jgi:FkbM family methyltransferase
LASYISRLQAEFKYWFRQYKKDPYMDQKNILAETEQGIIFDIGAHCGETTEVYAKYFSGSMIYSFEPFPDSYSKLKVRFSNNPMVKFLQMAISNRTGVVDFYSNADSATNSLLPVTGEAKKWSDRPDAILLKDIIKVKVSSIDELCKKEGIDHLMILKMDMQGGELRALEGAEKMLTNRAISLIYSELLFVPLYVGQAEYYQVCSLLSNYGYKLFDIYNRTYDDDGKIKWCDGLFVSTGLEKSK